jgi:hypothetical protein
MNGKTTTLFWTLTFCACAVCWAANAAQTVQSPDGTVKVEVVLKAGQPRWSVSFRGKPLIENGLLGVETAPQNFSGAYELAGTATDSHSATWIAPWGELREVPDRYNELTVKLKETAGSRRALHVVFRAYNEGVGLRYHFPAQPGLQRFTFTKRLTEYRFRANHPIYQCRNYEYGTVKIDRMSRSEGAVTVDLGDGTFAALTDADRADFPMVFWHNAKDRPNTILGRLHSDAVGAPPFSTSWEVLLIGADAAKLYENRYLVENLNPPCAIANTSWIRPGKAISQIRNARMVTAEIERLMDFASQHDIQYVEIDHSWCGAETKWTPAEIEFFAKNRKAFWDDKPEWWQNVGGNPMAPAKGWVPFRPKADSGGNFVDLDVAAAAAYGKRLRPPVGLCLYLRGAVVEEFGSEHPADKIFDVYQRWGVAGIKLGFVPCASQQSERAVADVVRKAAEHRLIVNIHDGYFPAGLTRTYPNLMNVEGVAGDESEHSIPPEMKSRHDVMLPFTRCLMGPVDYTPEMFKAAKTHAHQVAMLGVFNGRSSIRGGMKQWSPGGEGGSEVEFVKKLPGLFDEKRVYTDLGKYVTVARRRGNDWFIASMADGAARSVQLKLDFLTPGVAYQASIYADTPGKQTTTHLRQRVDAESVVRIHMEPNGGHLMIVEPVSSAAERSLVPETPSTVPDYYCTWGAQGYACSYRNASDQADAMIEANLFGAGPNQNWLGFYPKARADLTFLLDDACDFPLGGGHNHPVRGSVELDAGRFPSYRGTPVERLTKLSKDVRARGWRDLGLWICNSRPNVDRLPIDSETYWCERLAWSQQAGVCNWKVDWGIGLPDKPLWKFKVTPNARAAAPDVWIEFGGGQGDLYRTYDVHVSVSIPETIRRIAVFLAKEAPDDRRLINCEDEVYIGAGLGCTYGIMRHPLPGNLPDGRPDSYRPADFRNNKHRMDEVTRAVRWHRIAHPIPKGDAFAIDDALLTDFKSKPAPARIARGSLPLPAVTVRDGEQPPYVLCCRHAGGEIAVATIPRNLEENGRRKLVYPLADVTVEAGKLDRPVGIFGEYANLTLTTTAALSGKRILAQDLAGETPVDITAEIKLSDGKLTIPGSVIRRVGLLGASPGDVSDPGLVLAVEGLTQFVPKRTMKPGKLSALPAGNLKEGK